MQAELDEVKTLYVAMCEEKDKLTAEVDSMLHDKLSAELARVKGQLEQQKIAEVEQLKMTLQTTSDVTLASTKDKWLKEQKVELAKKVETEVKFSKPSCFPCVGNGTLYVFFYKFLLLPNYRISMGAEPES